MPPSPNGSRPTTPAKRHSIEKLERSEIRTTGQETSPTSERRSLFDEFDKKPNNSSNSTEIHSDIKSNNNWNSNDSAYGGSRGIDTLKINKDHTNHNNQSDSTNNQRSQEFSQSPKLEPKDFLNVKVPNIDMSANNASLVRDSFTASGNNASHEGYRFPAETSDTSSHRNSYSDTSDHELSKLQSTEGDNANGPRFSINYETSPTTFDQNNSSSSSIERRQDWQVSDSPKTQQFRGNPLTKNNQNFDNPNTPNTPTTPSFFRRSSMEIRRKEQDGIENSPYLQSEQQPRDFSGLNEELGLEQKRSIPSEPHREENNFQISKPLQSEELLGQTPSDFPDDFWRKVLPEDTQQPLNGAGVGNGLYQQNNISETTSELNAALNARDTSLNIPENDSLPDLFGGDKPHPDRPSFTDILQKSKNFKVLKKPTQEFITRTIENNLPSPESRAAVANNIDEWLTTPKIDKLVKNLGKRNDSNNIPSVDKRLKEAIKSFDEWLETQDTTIQKYVDQLRDGRDLDSIFQEAQEQYETTRKPEVKDTRTPQEIEQAQAEIVEDFKNDTAEKEMMKKEQHNTRILMMLISAQIFMSLSTIGGG